ncbi:hypothetical protein A7A09_014265 [Paracoccus methylarcula]|uniref:Uncharacterized protein n=1 Tax=Paracoccus methylarcula TaxID=72022 RepID=A0A422QVS4_9RHOB|nr:hypothetical protein A7A09_014265 [Paracoccus methylarcula]
MDQFAITGAGFYAQIDFAALVGQRNRPDLCFVQPGSDMSRLCTKLVSHEPERQVQVEESIQFL